MTFDKKFISGEQLRSKWSVDRQQFFEILSKASTKIPGNKKWLLRPHNPRNFKPVFYADGRPWPPCRLVGGKVVENFSPPEYDSNLDKAVEHVDRYYYLLEEVDVIERAMPKLVKGSAGRPKVMRAAALEAARSIKKNHPELTQREAAGRVNEYLKEIGFGLYSEKHLIKIIKGLNFLPGKPGRKLKNIG